MAGCRFLWQALRQAKSRPAYSAPFCCNIGLGQTNARGLGFGENSPISSLCHGRTSGREQVKLSVEETRKLLKVISLEGLKRGIEENGKECVSYKELLDMCKKWSFKATDEEASCIAKELEEAGVVLNFRGRVYLQPDQVARAFGHVMPLEVPSEKDPHRQEFLQLKKQKVLIDQMACKQVRRELFVGLGFLILQTAGFFRLTFWELSWDVMEPIVFHVASFYMICGYAFFLLTSKDPTYEGWFNTRFKSKQTQLMKKNNFNLQRFMHLQKNYNPHNKNVPFSTYNYVGESLFLGVR